MHSVVIHLEHNFLCNFTHFFMYNAAWFELQDVSERKIRFATNISAKDLMEKIEYTVTEMEFRVQKKNGKVSTTANV